MDRHAIAILCIIFHIDRCWKHSLWNVADGTEKEHRPCLLRSAIVERASEPSPAYGLTTSWYATFITHATSRGVGRPQWAQAKQPTTALTSDSRGAARCALSTNTGVHPIDSLKNASIMRRLRESAAWVTESAKSFRKAHSTWPTACES